MKTAARIAALEQELKALQRAKDDLELSDDFCHTNGRMNALLQETIALWAKLDKAKQPVIALMNTPGWSGTWNDALAKLDQE